MKLNPSISVAIIDDEENSRSILKKIIKKHLPNLEIICEAKNVKNAIAQINSSKPDLIFLDIRMPDGTGFDVLKGIDNYNVQIIFVTAHDNYTMEALKFHAFDYILKPINYIELTETVKTLTEKLYPNENDSINNLKSNMGIQNAEMHKLAIPLKGQIKYIALKDIVRLTADQSYTWISSANNEKIISSKNLGEYYKILENKNDALTFKFFRIHHSEIINTFYVKEFISKDSIVKLHDDSTLKIAARRISNFRKILKKIDN